MYFRGSNDILFILSVIVLTSNKRICEIPTLRSHLQSIDLGF